MSVRRKVGQARTRRATAATELAIMLPLLLTFCLAGVDMGRHAQTTMTLGNSARVGAEWGAGRRVTSYTSASWEADVKNAVLEELSNAPNFQVANVAVAVSRNTSTYVTPVVTVEVSYPFQTVVSWPFMPQPMTLTRRVAMCEYR